MPAEKVNDPKAFSSEVDTGSREENASNKEVEPPFQFNRNGKRLYASQSRISAMAAGAACTSRILRLTVTAP